MEKSLFTFVIVALAIWRVCHLLAREDGPADVIVRTRSALGNSFWGRLLDCLYCLSVWVAVPFALLFRPSIVEFVALWLGLSGAACLLERLGSDPVLLEPMPAPKAEAGVHDRS